MHKEKILTNDVLLIVLSEEQADDVTSSSEKDEYEMFIMTEKDIQEYQIK
jgi:hypothetical protein